MATSKSRRFEFLRCTYMTALILLGLVATTSNARAQSTDRDNPTPLASNEIRGNAIGRKVEYYYTFLAGPGDVVITVDSGAKGSFSQLEAQLFDVNAERLAQVQNLPYPGETSRKVARVSLGTQQPVLLRIFLDREAAQYLVRLGGAVQIAGADASFSGGSAASTTTTSAATHSTAPTSPDPAATQPEPAQPVPAQPVTPTEAPATTDVSASAPNPATGKTSGLKKLWLKLSSAGELLGLAGGGSLHVEMNDGTAQDIGLGKIKRMLVGEATQAPTDGSNVPASGEDKSTGWQRLWLKLGTAGELAGSNGRPLRIEMKDGTVQEFTPAKVKKVLFKR